MITETFEVSEKITRSNIIDYVNNLELKYENDFSLKRPIPEGLSDIDLLDPYYGERYDILKFYYENVLIIFTFYNDVPFKSCEVVLKYSNAINERVKENIINKFVKIEKTTLSTLLK
jgi:hypothetical protein